MSRVGRKPVPAATLKLRGSWRAKGRRDLPVENRRPIKPRWLTGEAAKEWSKIVPKLDKMGILAEVDQTMLVLYCKTYAEYMEADSLIKSILIKTSNGNIIQHPAVSIRNAAAERLRKLASEFGLSPAARSGLNILQGSPDGTNNKKRFFQGQNGNGSA